MSIKRRNRPQGYVRGFATRGESYTLNPRSDEHRVDHEKGRVEIQLKSFDLDLISDIPFYPSDVVPLGKPVLVDHGILAYHYGVYMHPTDYYWVKHDPEKAHKLVMSWIEQRIDIMVKAAEARLDAMVNSAGISGS